MNEQKYLIDECKRKWLIQTYLCNFKRLLRIAHNPPNWCSICLLYIIYMIIYNNIFVMNAQIANQVRQCIYKRASNTKRYFMWLTGVHNTGSFNGFAYFLGFFLNTQKMNNQRFETFNALYLPPPFIHLFIKRVLLLVLFLFMFVFFCFQFFLSKKNNFLSCADWFFIEAISSEHHRTRVWH